MTPTTMHSLPFIIAVDFDGTIVESRFPNIGPVREEFVRELLQLQKEQPDWKFILWTTRNNNIHGEYLSDAVSCTEALGLRFDAVNCNVREVQEMFESDTRKVFANVYIDDAAGFEGMTDFCNKRFRGWKHAT